MRYTVTIAKLPFTFNHIPQMRVKCRIKQTIAVTSQALFKKHYNSYNNNNYVECITSNLMFITKQFYRLLKFFSFKKQIVRKFAEFTGGLKDSRVGLTVSLGKTFHHSVNLLCLPWQTETPKELPEK